MGKMDLIAKHRQEETTVSRGEFHLLWIQSYNALPHLSETKVLVMNYTLIQVPDIVLEEHRTKRCTHKIDILGKLLKKLIKKVEEYSIPPHLNAKQSRILMIGPVGGGKSSFFNTIKAIFQERMVQQAMIGKDPQSLTKTYRQYEIQYKSPERTLNFRLCDTRGIEPTGRPLLPDLIYLLDGNVPDKYEFGEKPITPYIEGFIPEPKPQDKIHCVAFIFEASSLKVTSEDIWDKLKQLQIQMNSRGIPGVILLTKIDKLSENVGDAASKVFFSNDVKEAVEYVSEKLGVAPGNVMPIKNYENEIDLDDKISCLALQALDRMLGFALDGLVNQHDSM